MNDSLALVTILLSAVFTSNILLTNYLGMCSFLAVSKEIKTSLGLGAAVIFVMAFTCPLNWMIHAWVLKPLHLDYLSFIVFIVVIAAFVQVIEMIVERVSETLYANLGIFLPLITVNCAILGASLFMIIRKYTLAESFVYGAGSGLGWALAILAMAGIRQEKLNQVKLPRGLEGPAIALVVAGIMALAFMGFSGMGGGN
jgi:Na+-transporting NADH:ubiquinone oxidoreductase subunit E